MNQNDKQALIDPKDLFFAILKKAGIAILVGIIAAGALFGFVFASNTKDVNILDASTRIDGESDVEYAERVKKINRAGDIVGSIDALNNQLSNLREYASESVLMQINSENEAVTTAQLFVEVNDDSTNGIDKALVSSYSQDLKTGEYLAALAEEIGTKQGYLTELISVEYNSSTSAIVSSEGASGSAGTVTITVIGPDTDYTERIMDCILSEVDVAYINLNESMVPHVISLAGLQSSYKVDSITRDVQFAGANRFETVQKQIGLYDDSLNEIASELGVGNKDNIYAYFSFGDVDAEKSIMGSALKMAIIGFLAGVFVVLCIVALDYILSKKFSTQSKFYGFFPGVNKLGVAKPTSKRSWYARFIDEITGDDNKLSVENNNRLISANVKNLVSGMDKVLFIGTAENSRIKELVKELNVKADVKESFFVDPTSLESVAEYDGVIIVEQRGYSDCRLIEEEIALIANANTTLLGAIVI